MANENMNKNNPRHSSEGWNPVQQGSSLKKKMGLITL